MNINSKLQLVSIIPVVLALSLVLYITKVQYESLSVQSTVVYKESVINHRKEELRNYIAAARGAINHIYQDDTIDQTLAQNLVKEILANMTFGKDGYFFAYDHQGTNLVLPGQEWRIGKNWIEMQDVNGVMIIQELIKNADKGGGYVEYIFHQPSKKGDLGKKLAYSEPLKKWGWTIGTGVYIDDIDIQTSLISKSIKEYIDSTSQTTLIIGILSVITVFAAGLFIRISENRLANKKLRILNERIFRTQEEECKRVSRELHDGISQTAAATRFSLETIELKLLQGVAPTKDIEQAIINITKIISDIRCISHQLHPGVLEDYGLGAALDELGNEFSLRTNIQVEVVRLSVRNILTSEVKNALYRISQEAFTNIERHSNASQVKVSLFLKKKWLILKIEDNGGGFNFKEHQSPASSNEGIGLRNMKERLNFYHGKFTIKADNNGTTILACIPQSELRYNADLKEEKQ